MKRSNAILAALALAALLAVVAAPGAAVTRQRTKPVSWPALPPPKGPVDTLFFDDFESDTLAWGTTDVLVQQPYWHIDS
ncbi:MAG: hypothetical protein MUF78_11530, partial [Candidatus Edwardsbacteria bacterium]|nr:hypothetical protein [Candidatus Edwardsbacteria bacterium]